MPIKSKIIIISGPTASGKSLLARQLAAFLNGVIINADAIQLYKELPILSAQPSQKEQKEVDHLLYGIKNHNEESSVANWLKIAATAINKCILKQTTPIITGGTGLYISKLVDGINPMPEISAKIKEGRLQLQKLNNEELKEILEKLGDKDDKIQHLDKQRLIRRIEILKQTGKTLDWWQEQPKQKFYDKSDFIHINLSPPRENLYDKCNKRFSEMLDSGAIEEVQNLIKIQIPDNSSICKTIGYFEIQDYLNGLISKELMIDKACQKTRNYAKRQLTWFRNQFKNHDVIKIEKSEFDINQVINLIKQHED